MHLKRDKCRFLQESVEYLGHRVDAQGFHTSEKVRAIQKAPKLNNAIELCLILGLLNYYWKFIPNMASLVHPLNALLRIRSRWKWTKQCADAFQAAKDQLAEAPVLAHYNPQLPIWLAGNASSYGIGAVFFPCTPRWQ